VRSIENKRKKLREKRGKMKEGRREGWRKGNEPPTQQILALSLLQYY
jgi:hypothetical protein